MTHQVIIRENAKAEYKIVLRNASVYDVAVKIENNNKGLVLDRHECLVLSNKYTELAVLETPKKVTSPVKIYCRAIYPFNRKNIRNWIEGEVADKQHHLVKSLKFEVDDSEFSARKIIVDLPGKSSVYESTGFGIKMNNSKDVLRAFLEKDTSSAMQMESKSVLKYLPKVVKPDTSQKSSKPKAKAAPADNKNDESCFIIPLFKALCNPATKVETV